MADVSRVRFQLGKDLRAARTLAGLSQRALHARLGESPSQVTLSRMENGTAVPDRDLVTRWLTACAANEEIRDRVLAQLDAAHNETRAWSDMLGDDTHLQGVARIRDDDAHLIRVCQLGWIPGLLQTAEYARQQLPQVDPTGRMDYPAAVAARIERQHVLYGTGRTCEFLIAETALLWEPGPGVMREQLDKLLSIATLAAVDLRVLPSRRTGAASWTSFEYREAKEDGRATVTTEWLHGGGEFSDPEQVQLYRLLWTRLWEASAAGKHAVELIRGIRGAGLTHSPP